MKRNVRPSPILNCMHDSQSDDSSFPVMHRVGNVGIFVLLKFENEQDTVFGHFNFNSKHHD